MTDKDFMDFIDEVLPKCSEHKMKDFIKQVDIATDKQLKELAEKDPLADIPLA